MNGHHRHRPQSHHVMAIHCESSPIHLRFLLHSLESARLSHILAPSKIETCYPNLRNSAVGRHPLGHPEDRTTNTATSVQERRDPSMKLPESDRIALDLTPGGTFARWEAVHYVDPARAKFVFRSTRYIFRQLGDIARAVSNPKGHAPMIIVTGPFLSSTVSAATSTVHNAIAYAKSRRVRRLARPVHWHGMECKIGKIIICE